MLNKKENKAFEGIKANPYMQKTIALVEDFVENHTSKDNKIAYLAAFDEIFRILNEAKPFVDGETQKPDCDLVIYSLNKDETLKKCMILSLKTSLRERAGQTYKWKLLMEIATSENPIKEKYNIDYNPEKMPLIGFATVNFYNEINNPQHRGMFKFFDKSFIAKNIDADFISRLSTLPKYINENL